jgi:hypothetical protein
MRQQFVITGGKGGGLKLISWTESQYRKLNSGR